MANMNLNKCPMPSQDPMVRNSNFKEVALGYTFDMAVEEAQRCLNCKTKPCISGCPVYIDIPAFSISPFATSPIKAGISIYTGQPLIQGFVLQLRHLCASSTAISNV